MPAWGTALPRAITAAAPVPPPPETARLLSVESPRRVARDATISLQGKRYGVPAEYLGRHVWVLQLDDQLQIEHGGKTIARHTL